MVDGVVGVLVVCKSVIKVVCLLFVVMLLVLLLVLLGLLLFLFLRVRSQRKATVAASTSVGGVSRDVYERFLGLPSPKPDLGQLVQRVVVLGGSVSVDRDLLVKLARLYLLFPSVPVLVPRENVVGVGRRLFGGVALYVLRTLDAPFINMLPYILYKYFRLYRESVRRMEQ